MFGGLIRESSPQLYRISDIPDNFSLMNFNDTISTFITLFSLIIVNNWYVIVDLCVSIKDGNVYYRYYFIIFYYFGVIIGLNIIIAFAIDMYSSVERLDTQQQNNEKKLIQISEKFDRKKIKKLRNSLRSSMSESVREIEDKAAAESFIID